MNEFRVQASTCCGIETYVHCATLDEAKEFLHQARGDTNPYVSYYIEEFVGGHWVRVRD